MFPRINLAYGCVVLLIVSLVGQSCKKDDVFQHREKPEVPVAGDDVRLQGKEIRFYSDTVYVLTANLVIDSGKVLLIDAGTFIKVNNKVSVVVREGARIDAKGTEAAPIVFTSSAAKGGAGVGTGTSGGERWWYGINILGNALRYPSLGSSGSMRYVRIEFAGGNFGGNGSPGLLLQDVMKGTVVDHVQVSYTFYESSFRISGGDFNASHLVSYASASNDFHIDQGYTGKLQHLLAYRHPYFPFSGSGGTGGQDFAGLLLEGVSSFPVVSNLTVVGPDTQPGTSIEYNDTITPGPFGTGRRVAALIVKGGKFRIGNSVFAGFPKGGFYLDDRDAAVSLNDGASSFKHSIVECHDSSRAFFLGPTVFPPFGSKDFRALVMEPGFANEQLLRFTDLKLASPFNYDINPDPNPAAGSPLQQGAAFEGAFADPFFQKTTWRGALGSDAWLKGWTNFVPLQTNYNN